MSIMIKKLLFIIFTTLFIIQAHAKEVKKMGKHKDWETYIIKSDAEKFALRNLNQYSKLQKQDKEKLDYL